MEYSHEIAKLKSSLIDKMSRKSHILAELKFLVNNINLFDYLRGVYNTDNPQQILYHVRNGSEIPLCTCGKPLMFNKYSKGYFKTCGDKSCVNSLRVESISKTTISKHGVAHTSMLESVQLKMKGTTFDRYGVEHNWKGHMRKKYEQTMFEKYGVRHALQNEDIKKKRHNTCNDRHGTADFFHCEKSMRTNEKKYGSAIPATTPEIKSKIRESNARTSLAAASAKLSKFGLSVVSYDGTKQKYELLCAKCGTSFIAAGCTVNAKLRSGIDPCITCNPLTHVGTSKKEKELAEFVAEEYSGSILRNYRGVVEGYELDVYLPDLNVAIEFNGLYWHSELYVDHKYHMDKTNAALACGIAVYHVWEDDWDLRRDIVKSMIRNIVGKSTKIHARKCGIVRLDNSSAREFFEKNHIQGWFNSSNSYGLVYDSVLLSAMSFSKMRMRSTKLTANEWELVRFANASGFSITGGASKLLSHFIKDVQPEIITSFCDISMSPDSAKTVYSAIGFTLDSATPPSPHWVIDGIRRNRLTFTKSKLVKMGYDEKKTSIEIMAEQKYYRCFDCGHWKFSFKPVI